jgi:ribonuclease Z
VTQLCLTHFHGDHCLGVPGVIQRLSLDRVSHPVVAHYPASGKDFFWRMRNACAFYDTVNLREQPITADGVLISGAFGTLSARKLDHRVETYGYRLVEPDGRRMLPDRLAARGVAGPDIGRLLREGAIDTASGPVALDEVSVVRRGQRAAVVMDTRLCDGVFALADGVDLLLIEATFLEADAALATEYGHLTAGQAARVAAECGVRTLVLSHFSQRYADAGRFGEEAAEWFDGEIVVAEDLMTVRVPRRR